MTELEADGGINTCSETGRQRDRQKSRQILSSVLTSSLVPLVCENKLISYRLPEGSSERVNWWIEGVKSKRMVSVFARQNPLDLSTSTK